MDNFLKIARNFALAEQARTSMPLLQHIDLSRKVALRLAKKLGADELVVESGIYLMNCMIGEALKQNRLQNHIKMSADKTIELFEHLDISQKNKDNIINCVLEHHGARKFYSLESEICCNADCYRFVSIKGFTYALRFLRDMSFGDLIKLLNNKLDEKWGVLTLDICKKELTPQYKIIQQFLNNLVG